MKLLLISICFSQLFQIPPTDQSVELFNRLLSENVNEEGAVNYKGFIEEKEKFVLYLNHLSSNPPKKEDKESVKLAYWINAYNAFTIKLIIDNYPLESITDLNPLIYIPGFNTVWHKEFFKIGDEDFNLDRIEHEILRKQFKEERIHFAINCASKSCPKLRNEVYRADKLEEQLIEQTRDFLSDNTKNKIEAKKVRLSKIFSWFRSDFERNGSLISFINKYSDVRISEHAEISFLPYDWTLNE